MNPDEVGNKALMLGGYTRECLNALPDMSPEVRGKVAQMLYRDMDRSADLDSIMGNIFALDFDRSHRVMTLVTEQSTHWPTSKVMERLAHNATMAEWVKRNEGRLMRKMGVGRDPHGRSFYAAKVYERTWNISVKWKDAAGRDREDLHKLEGPATEEEAHDLWIERCSKELEAQGTNHERRIA